MPTPSSQENTQFIQTHKMRKHSTTFEEFVERYRSRLIQIVDEAANACSDPGLVYNAKVVLLLREDPDVRAVAKKLGRSINQIMQIRARFMLLGLPGLHKIQSAPRPSSPDLRSPASNRPVKSPPLSDYTDQQVLTGLQIYMVP